MAICSVCRGSGIVELPHFPANGGGYLDERYVTSGLECGACQGSGRRAEVSSGGSALDHALRLRAQLLHMIAAYPPFTPAYKVEVSGWLSGLDPAAQGTCDRLQALRDQWKAHGLSTVLLSALTCLEGACSRIR